MDSYFKCSKCWKSLSEKNVYIATKADEELNFEFDGFLLCAKCAMLKKLGDGKIFKLELV